MRRVDRLFEIIQVLRAASKPVTADELAARLEVTARTVYRDIAVLQGQRVPIVGEAGIGYVMRAGFDLPPLMFSNDEVEAVIVGLGLLNRTGDTGLQDAASRVSAKICAVLPNLGDEPIDAGTLHVSDWGANAPAVINLSDVRAAIRNEQKIRIAYADLKDTVTERVIQPIALQYFLEVVVIAAWCELRQDFRHFRADRISAAALQDDHFTGQGKGLRKRWLEYRDAAEKGAN